MATKGQAAPEVGQIYARARELCEQLGASSYLPPVLFGLFLFHNIRANYSEALELGKAFLDLTTSRNDPAQLVAHRMIGFTLLLQGELRPALEQFEQIALRYDPAQHRSLTWLYGSDIGSLGLSYKAVTLWLLGYPDQALEACRAALSMGREVSHALSQANAFYWAVTIHQYRREWRQALELAEALVEMSREQGLPVYLAFGTRLRMRCLLMTEQENVEERLEVMQRSLDAYQATGAEAGLSSFYRELAEAYAKAGRPRAALAALDTALALVEKNNERSSESVMFRLRGELLLVDGEAAEEAEPCFHRAIEIARRQGAKSLELHAVMSLARLWRQQGKAAEARQMLAEIYGWFTEGLDTADLKEAKALLYALG